MPDSDQINTKCDSNRSPSNETQVATTSRCADVETVTKNTIQKEGGNIQGNQAETLKESLDQNTKTCCDQSDAITNVCVDIATIDQAVGNAVENIDSIDSVEEPNTEQVLKTKEDPDEVSVELDIKAIKDLSTATIHQNKPIENATKISEDSKKGAEDSKKFPKDSEKTTKFSKRPTKHLEKGYKDLKKFPKDLKKVTRAANDSENQSQGTSDIKQVPSMQDYQRWTHCKESLERCFTQMMITENDRKSKTFDELCKMVVQPTFLYVERKRFYEAKRSYQESLEQFTKRLKELSSNCQFGERQDIMIADKIIVGQAFHVFNSIYSDIEEEVDSTKALESVLKHNTDPVQKGLFSGYEFNETLLNVFPTPVQDNKMKDGENSLKNISPKLISIIRDEIMEQNVNADWDEIAGLDAAKSAVKESVVWPLLRPDIFTGLRKVPRAILLFGPPGSGKTTIGKCIASQSKSTFFFITASVLTSKFYGESEKIVRALFSVAAAHQPSVIFFDEVDSLLTQRSATDRCNVSTRIKTEFMVHLENATTKENTQILFVGATNRPQDLDDAFRRRFSKRLYIPPPNYKARLKLLEILLKHENSNLTKDELKEIAKMTKQYSGADIKWLCQDASMQPLREISPDRIETVDIKDIRPIKYSDFIKSLKHVRPTVVSNDLTAFIEWNRLYGSCTEKCDSSDSSHMMYT